MLVFENFILLAQLFIKSSDPQNIPYTAKLSRGKTFAVHQAHAIMYCTQQMIQGENFRDWLKHRENRESFPPRKFCRIRYASRNFVQVPIQ